MTEPAQLVYLFTGDFGEHEKLRKRLEKFLQHEDIVKEHPSFSSKMLNRLSRIADNPLGYNAPTVEELFENLRDAPPAMLSLQKRNEEKLFVTHQLPAKPVDDPVSLQPYRTYIGAEISETNKYVYSVSDQMHCSHITRSR